MLNLNNTDMLLRLYKVQRQFSSTLFRGTQLRSKTTKENEWMINTESRVAIISVEEGTYIQGETVSFMFLKWVMSIQELLLFFALSTHISGYKL